jgi:hypothetical protein
LRALGFEGNNLEDVEKQRLEDASIVVEMDEYNGEERPKVRWVNAKGSINLKPMENKSNFAKSMAAKIAALEAGQGPAKAESLDEVLDDDDVPFNV